MINWYLQNGKDSDVVISSRIRLARNLADFHLRKSKNKRFRASVKNYKRNNAKHRL